MAGWLKRVKMFKYGWAYCTVSQLSTHLVSLGLEMKFL